MTLADTADRVLDLAARKSGRAEAEAFLVESEGWTEEWSEGLPENRFISRAAGLGLRLIDQGRLGFAHSNRLDEAGIGEVVEAAGAATRTTAADPHCGLPTPAAGPAGSLDLVDATLRPDSAPERSQFLSTLETEIRSRDPRIKKVLRAGYSEGRHQAVVHSSRGVQADFEGTSVSFSLACVAVDGNETQMGYGFQTVRHYSDLRRGWVIDRAVEGALALLGGRPLPSGRYDLVLDPLVGAEMLELFANALRADQVLKGKSFLASRSGESIGSPALSIIDDGRLARGVGSSPVDGEGIPTQRNLLVDQGVLRGFLYDTYTARRANRRSTGSAGRASYKGIPGPDTTNFFIAPGEQSPEAILSEVRSGIYVRTVMGLHTVDTISGDFSLGIMGERIENGRRTHGVRGVTIAGNLLDLLRNLAAAGSDLIFSGSIGSPTLWIRDISVGGT